ncbi:MAG: hypothetical protein R2733_06835 [Acidimicrobiales bacterium]
MQSPNQQPNAERPDGGNAPLAGIWIDRLVGVYDADHTLRGEVAYWVGARLGRRHCSLCDITHGTIREKSAWTACRNGLPVEFVTFHRDDQPDSIREVLAGQAPAVLAETDRGPLLLVGPAGLAACDGSTDELVTAIEASVKDLGLVWPAPKAVR